MSHKIESTVKEEPMKDYEHRQKISEMLKVIQMCPMDDHIKMVMRCRIWGVDPKVFMPLSADKIAYLDIKSKGRVPTQAEINKVQDIEDTGVFMCKQFLLSQKSQDIVDRFNHDAEKYKGQMFGVQPFERGKFSV